MLNFKSRFSAKSCKKGFTLAETLITLVIIGIIAAITVPTLIIGHQKEEALDKIKKAYSTLQQTKNQAIMENGQPKTWTMANGNTWENARDFSETYIVPYLSVIYRCPLNSNETRCRYKIYGLNKQQYSFSATNYKFYLADGTLLYVFAQSDNNNKGVQILFDINGSKKPNIVGRDVFKIEYWLISNKSTRQSQVNNITPAYAGYDRATLLGTGNNEYCNKQKIGLACLAVIMKDSWTFQPDYPW